MALLGSGFDQNVPAGSETPTLGDNKIREIKDKLKTWASVQHDPETGVHKIPRLAVAPEGYVDGQLYIKITSGEADELWEYKLSTTTWIKLTSNQSVVNYVNTLATHIASNPIDHADGSITGAKIANNTITGANIVDGAITGAKIADGTITPEKLNFSIADEHDHVGGDGALLPQGAFANYAAGNCIIHRNLASVTITNVSPYEKKIESIIGRAGSLRIWFTLRKALSGERPYGRIYRNDIAVGTIRSNDSTGDATFVEDISGWSVGDRLQIYCYKTGLGDPSTVLGLAIGVSNATVLTEAEVVL